MLDKRTAAVLEAINDACGEGGYKVLEAEELMGSIPRRLGTDKEEVVRIVNYLCEREYVSVKYQDGEEFCLCPLPRGRQYSEREQTDRKENHRKFERHLVVAFFGAMIGAIVGGAIGALITALLLK